MHGGWERYPSAAVEWFEEPAVILVVFVLAAALFVVEVALPTLGIAGTAAVGLAILGFVGLDREGSQAWPLAFVGAGVGLWGVMIARRAAPPTQQGTAAALFGAGSLGFAVVATDWAAAVVAAVASIALPGMFPTLFRSAVRLLGSQPQVGLEALVGDTGTVVAWQGDRGTVRVSGSLWNARSAHALSPGAEVTVIGFDGMTLQVALPIAAP